MKRIVSALAIAALAVATPASAQDIVGSVAATVDQFGQSMAESMTGGPGVFVTAQGKTPLPAASATAMTLTLQGKGATAVEAVADRNARLERVRAVANRFDVAVDVGDATYGIGQARPAWMGDAASVDAFAGEDDMGVAVAAPSANGMEGPAAPSVTASVQIEIDRPNETRLPAFIDALVEAGVTDLQDSLNGLNLGQFAPFAAMLGLNLGGDPGEAVWLAATADGVARARAQAEAIANASGRRLGPVRYVSVLMRSQDGENAVVTVAARFGLE